jgi:hypothetical protein
MLPPGNAGSNAAADHIQVTDDDADGEPRRNDESGLPGAAVAD